VRLDLTGRVQLTAWVAEHEPAGAVAVATAG
jgi:hypothetical protein